MAHWTLELAQACIAGGALFGPWKNKNGTWEIRSADVDEATLYWNYRLGHRGSVHLIIEGEEGRHEMLFSDLWRQGWVPVTDNPRTQLRKLRALLRKNQAKLNGS